MTRFAIGSSAFSHEGPIPRRYTCEGDDVSPPLSWSGIPAGAKSLALIVADPDAPDPSSPKLTWIHWIVLDIPPNASGLPEDVAAAGLPAGATEGINSWKSRGYGGPCPPVGRHRYFFQLFALDEVLSLDAPTKDQVEKAMDGHILGRAVVMGTYEM